MSDAEDRSKWMPDYNHLLLTVKPELEDRLNRKAKMVKRLCGQADSERARLLTIDVTSLLFQVFRVEGPGVQGGCDDTFLKLSQSALNAYDLAAGIPFSHFFRYLYSRRKRDAVTVSDQFNHDANSIEAIGELSKDGRFEWGSFDEWDESGYVEDNLEALPAEQVARHDDAAMGKAFASFLALIIGFLDHAVDKRDHTLDKKLYTRIFFTESITRLVKTRVLEEECKPFEDCEHEVFSSLELPLQDEYMAAICRTIKDIWLSNLREGYGCVDYNHRSWRLTNSVIIDYYEQASGKAVSAQAISQQRGNYRKLIEGCGFKQER